MKPINSLIFVCILVFIGPPPAMAQVIMTNNGAVIVINDTLHINGGFEQQGNIPLCIPNGILVVTDSLNHLGSGKLIERASPNQLFNSTIMFSGPGNKHLTGTGIINFNNLRIETPDSVILSTQVEVNDTIDLQNGIIDLNGNNFILRPLLGNGTTPALIGTGDPLPEIEGESDPAGKITGPGTGTSGEVRMSVGISGTPPFVNPGNMGFELNNVSGLGNQIQLRRGHVSQTIPNVTAPGIFRYYDFQQGNPASADITLDYLESEFNSVNLLEESMIIFQRSSGTWSNIGKDNLNTANNSIQKNGVTLTANQFDRFTLLPCNDAPVISFPQNPIPHCDAGPIRLSAGFQKRPTDFVWMHAGNSIGGNSQFVQFQHQGPGTYSFGLIATDIGSGCVTEGQFTVVVEEMPSGVLPQDQNICSGESLKLDLGPPVNGVSYQWIDVTSSSLLLTTNPSFLFRANQPGFASIQVIATGAGGNCIIVDTISITTLPGVGVDLGRDTVLCMGEQITLSSRFPANQFDWNTGATTPTLTVSPTRRDTFSLKVVNPQGCSGIDTIIVDVSSLSVGNTVSAVSCFGGNDGEVSLFPNSPIGQVSISWNTNPVQTSHVISGLATGSYQATVSDTACSVVHTFVVPQPIEITVDMANATDANCLGQAGSINLSVSGGTPATQAPGYQFQWTQNSNPFPSTTQNLAGLDSGNYVVTITDVNNCQITHTPIRVNRPPELNIAILDVGVGNTKEPGCFGFEDGEIEMNVSNGTAPFNFIWSNGGLTQNLGGLASGIYYVLATDAAGCEARDTLALGEPLKIITDVDSVDATCGGANGVAFLSSLGGGTGGFSLKWATISGVPVADTSLLPAGIYFVVATDNSGCFDTTFFNIVNQDGPIISREQVDTVKCAGGSDGAIDVSITGNSLPFTINWSNGEITPDIDNLTAGSYTLTVEDANGCINTLLVDIPEPDSLDITVVRTQAIPCSGFADGKLKSIVTGGNSPYTFAWSNGSSTDTAVNLLAGNYSLTVTDDNNCILQENNIVVSEPDEIQVTETITDVTCNGFADGNIMLAVSGGTPFPLNPYRYDWNDIGPSFDAIRVNLSGGTYPVIVKDENGCIKLLNPEVGEPDSIAITGEETAVTCFGLDDGRIEITPSGGITPFSFLWNDQGTSEVRTGLTPGVYQVTATDANGCFETQDYVIPEPDTLIMTLFKQDAGCKDENSGAVQVIAGGGNLDYVFSWSTGDIGANLSGLTEGTFSVTVTDQKGCTDQQTFVIGRATETFEAFFLASSPVHTADTLVFIDVSFPEPNKWVWNFGDDPAATSNEPNPFHVYEEITGAGDTLFYDASLIAWTDQCIDTLVKLIKVINGPGKGPDILPEYDSETESVNFERLVAYPNPTTGRLTLEVGLNRPEDISVRLIDLKGLLIQQKELKGQASYSPSFDLGNLANGVYLLTVRLEDQVKNLKIVLTR